jgi:hypothetical protein
MINDNYSILFSRPSPAEQSRVSVDKMPEDLNWIAMVDRLSNGDITKHDQIYKTNYVECLNTMAYWYHKDKFIEQVNKAVARKNKHS